MKNRREMLAWVGLLAAALLSINTSFVSAQESAAESTGLIVEDLGQSEENSGDVLNDAGTIELESDASTEPESAVEEASPSVPAKMVSRTPNINALGGVAQFTVAVQTDSEKTSGRHYTVTRYLNEQCQRPKRNAEFFRKKYAKETHEFTATEIESGGEFLFQIDYLEKRRGGDRACSTLIKFSPEAGHSYKFGYSVTGQVSRCIVTAQDLSTGEVQQVANDDLPENSCKKSKVSGNRNGVPVHTVNPLY